MLFRSKKINFQRKYQDDEILYSAIAAKSGKIEKVVIKKCVNHKIYLDGLNTLWHERDLLRLDQVNDFIEKHQERISRSFVRREQVVKTRKFANDFDIGTMWASKSFAIKGSLVKFIIRRNLNDNVVEDTSGGIYNKEDLISVAEAKSIALAYWLEKRERLVDVINQSNQDVP